LIDENHKVYLCDFGWGSINCELDCGIGIWNCNNKQKPGGFLYDDTSLERLGFTEDITPPYMDVKRKVGSQSEIPSIHSSSDDIIVSGYQEFTINRKTHMIKYKKKVEKYLYFQQLTKELKNESNCTSMVDIGCSSGLYSFMAYNSGFEHIVSLDHDTEYIDKFQKIINLCNIKNINPYVYSFGDTISETFDVVFCGAIIHWIFSLTSDFRNFNSIIEYIVSLSKQFLVIEWVDPKDAAIVSFNHITRRQKDGDETYNTHNFEQALQHYTTIVKKTKVDGTTRTMYVCKIF